MKSIGQRTLAINSYPLASKRWWAISMWCSRDSRGRSVPAPVPSSSKLPPRIAAAVIGVRPVAQRRRVHPGAEHRRRDPGQRRRAHGLLGHRPARPEVGLEVAGPAIDADDAERQLRVGRRERERDSGAPAVPDHHERLGMAEPREQSLEIARHGVEVVAAVGAVALAVAGQVDGDHPVGGDEVVGDQVPPARVARQPVEREQGGLATGMISHRERQSRRIDAVFVDRMGHVRRDCRR